MPAGLRIGFDFNPLALLIFPFQPRRGKIHQLTRYGVPDQLSGAIGILGPMRMPYGEAISTVRYVAELMSALVSDNLIN